MPLIRKIYAREILDSRGNPTVEVELTTTHARVTASVPSGTSRGRHEAAELRDGGKRFHGMGVKKAVRNVNEVIFPKLKGKNPLRQREIDELMISLDGTKDKSRLGANAILAVSMAVCKAGAVEARKPLYGYINQFIKRKMRMPVPYFNVINGGRHAGNGLDIQEYMVAPVGAKSYSEALVIGAEVYQSLRELLTKKYGKAAVNVGDEGGFAPPISDYKTPVEMIVKAAKKAGHLGRIGIGLDIAASEFYKEGRYRFGGAKKTPRQMQKIYEGLAKAYPIISIEDPFEQEAFGDFAGLRKALKKVQIVGDDLLTTNPKRIRKAIDAKSCTCLLLKINQIGTVTEAIEAAKLAFKNRWNVMVSHRSGETNETFIAELAVGLGAGQLKAGAPCRGERLAKYNQLLRIGGNKVSYGGFG